MIDNFLTIPDAPNYEINSNLLCRNKLTKHLLTLQLRPGMAPYYSLRNKEKTKFTIKRSPKTLRKQAVAAAKPDIFEPIPSANGKYEISPRGVVRNSKTKHILKRKGHGHCVGLRLANGFYVTRAIKDLLWEVHGIIKPRRFRPQPCSAENRLGMRCSHSDAARQTAHVGLFALQRAERRAAEHCVSDGLQLHKR